MIKIGDNLEYLAFANNLTSNKIEAKKNIDNDDYYWFLTTLSSAIRNKQTIEILNDTATDIAKYKVIECSINDTNIYEITLLLEKIDDKSNLSISYSINEIEEASGEDYRKYYLKSNTGKFRFLINLNI